MRSNVCEIKRGGVGLESILREIEKVTAYNGLPKKEALRLRLLAEELAGMLRELVKQYEGVFWMQNDGMKYELVVELFVQNMSKEKKEALIDLAASKKNAAAKGFMGRIREVAENMLLHYDDPETNAVYYQCLCEYGTESQYSYAWTMDHYVSQFHQSGTHTEEEWDELEKSIVAKLADDVIVGVRGKSVDIIIKKEF